jgi:hypothetical protein
MSSDPNHPPDTNPNPNTNRPPDPKNGGADPPPPPPAPAPAAAVSNNPNNPDNPGGGGANNGGGGGNNNNSASSSGRRNRRTTASTSNNSNTSTNSAGANNGGQRPSAGSDALRFLPGLRRGLAAGSVAVLLFVALVVYGLASQSTRGGDGRLQYGPAAVRQAYPHVHVAGGYGRDGRLHFLQANVGRARRLPRWPARSGQKARRVRRRLAVRKLTYPAGSHLIAVHRERLVHRHRHGDAPGVHDECHRRVDVRAAVAR